MIRIYDKWLIDIFSLDDKKNARKNSQLEKNNSKVIQFRYIIYESFIIYFFLYNYQNMKNSKID